MIRSAVAAYPRRSPDNPYCDLLYTHLTQAGVEVIDDAPLSFAWLMQSRHRVRVLHLHWPENLYRAGSRQDFRGLAGFTLKLLLARILRYRIVWTVHNLDPHEFVRGDQLARWLLLRLAFPVVHGFDAVGLLRGARRTPAVIPHGNYIGAYPDEMPAAAARRTLGLPAQGRVILCFGQIREYKGIDRLLEVFHSIVAPEATLVIAGRPRTDEDARALRARARHLGDSRIRLHLRHVPDDEVQNFFRACDFVCLPYRSVLTSGAAILALSFARPLVVPRIGHLCDLEKAGCAVTYDPGDQRGLGEALEKALSIDPRPLGDRARSVAEAWRWDRIALQYREVYAA